MLAALLVPLTLKVSVALVAAWAVTRAMARCSAASRHLVWTLALASMLMLPAAHILSPRWALALLPARPPVHVQQPSIGQSAERPNDVSGTEWFSAMPIVSENDARLGAGTTTSTTTSGADLDWTSILLMVWLGGTIVALLRFIIGLISVRRITRRATPISNPEWMAMLRDASVAVRLTRPVRLKSSVDTTIPVACGVVTPTVLLPPDADRWAPDRRGVVLLHELAHVTRRDCLVQCIAQIARAVHWFNPLAHLAISRLRAEQERACDDLVLAAGTDGPLYANHLIEIARASVSPQSQAWAVLAMAHRSHLEGRLMAILNDQGNRRPPTRWVRTVVTSGGGALIVLLGALQLTAAASRADIELTEPSLARVHALEGAVASAVADRPHRDARADAVGRPSQSSSSSPHSRDEPPAAPRMVDQVIDRLPDIDLDFDFNPNPKPNPRPNVQLKDASGLQAPEVSEETRRRVADALQTALADDSEEVRMQAMWALGGVRDERAVPGLLKGASDASPRVRMAALGALAQFSTTEAIDGIVAALKDPNADVRALAVRYVSGLVRRGALNDTKYVDLFVGLLRDGAPDVRVQAVTALGRLGRTEAVPMLLPLLKDTSIDVRRRTAAALGDIADPRAVDALTAALKDADAEVREEAARALGQIARGQRAVRPGAPVPPTPPGLSVPPLPPLPPRVQIDQDAINDMVSRAQEEVRRSREELDRQRRELQRQQEELQRQLR